MPSVTFTIVERAISEHAIVVADYQGYRREMCPHILGYKGGREHCLLYQFAGQSKSGLGPPGSLKNWRCVFVDELRNVATRIGAWHTASYQEQRQTCVEEVVAEVKF
jgi:hypothetical protein